MQIGITERGDASIDYSWTNALINKTVDGAILITKNITPKFTDAVLDIYKNHNDKIIVHCTCTGWGSSYLEPNVPDYMVQLNNLYELINKGFPKQNCVLRIDPIIPTAEGIIKMKNVIDTAYTMGLLPNLRTRISIYDEYYHVRDRLKQINKASFYNNSFTASRDMINNLIVELSNYHLEFETCAENILTTQSKQFKMTGCVSVKDINIMGLPVPKSLSENGQNRTGCHCLKCKTELLSNKKQCPNKCVYCYWKNK
jgi:hypothetical protein